MSILCHFRALWGIAAFDFFGSAFEGHGSPPPVNSYMCVHPESKNDVCKDYFQKKGMQVLLRVGVLYHRFKQSVPESESRQFEDSDTWLIATTPGVSDSGSEPLHLSTMGLESDLAMVNSL